MTLLAITFVAGNLLACLQTALPPMPVMLLATMALPALAFRQVRPVAVFVLGFWWAGIHLHVMYAQSIPGHLLGRTVLIEGKLIDRPAMPAARRTRLLLQTSQLDDGNGWQPFTQRLRLDWYGEPPAMAIGERWQLAVRLKHPAGYANPGGFDYELWLFRQHIRATGYVRDDVRNRRIAPARMMPLARLRSRLADAMAAPASELPSMALVQALTIGARDLISPTQWQVLRATGTSHLMAISGLHISLVAGLCFWCGQFTWSRASTLAARLPAARAAAVAAMSGALLYALLSGFAIPAQRALIMVTVLMLALMTGRRIGFPGVIGVAAIVTLLMDPLSLLSPGWWLSFSAVSIIAWFVIGRAGHRQRTRHWLFMPVVLAVCMGPLLLLFFQQVSLVAPLANILAVPWVSVLVVPLSLAGVVLHGISATAGLALLKLAAWFLALLWHLLEWLASFEHALFDWPQPAAWVLATAAAGVALLCVPRGVPARWPAALLLLPLLVPARVQPAPGEVWLTLLDVGQGLAAVIRTARHVLVYDTGPAFGEDFDTGRAVIAPYLRHQGIRHIDRLLISHADNDHIGGAASLLASFSVDEILTSVPSAFAARHAQACTRGLHWTWDEVEFTLLHPPADAAYQGNDASCVLHIRTADGRGVLLPGDIEQAAERTLLDFAGTQLASTVLIVPHHGSKTSSTPAFVRAVDPQLALLPAGYRNRYHFPHPAVTARYTAQGSDLLQTGHSGAITVRLSPLGEPPAVSRYRQVHPRLWRRPE